MSLYLKKRSYKPSAALDRTLKRGPAPRLCPPDRGMIGVSRFFMSRAHKEQDEQKV